MAHVHRLAQAVDVPLGGAQLFAKIVEETRAAGDSGSRSSRTAQIMPALDCFDAASQGKIEAFHAGSIFWDTKEPAFQWFTTVPFGMNCEGMAAWHHQGDGLKLWEETYAAFNLVPRQGQGSGPETGGWYRKKVTTTADYKGLKMRIPGLGGKVVARAGATVVTLAPGDIYAALERGVIDTSEFIGPHDDMKLGLHETARYYYYPGWHQPGTMLEFVFNKKAYEAPVVCGGRSTMPPPPSGLRPHGLHVKNTIALGRLRTEFKAESKFSVPGAGKSPKPAEVVRKIGEEPHGQGARRRAFGWWARGTTSPKAPTSS